MHIMRDAQFVTRRVFIRIQWHGIRHGMTDKTARDIKSVVKRFFERQKSQHQIGGPSDFENAFLSPRPHGWADVMDRFDPLLFQVPFKGNIEIRRINADKYIGLEVGKAAGKVGADMQQATQAAQHLDDAHHSQLFHFIPGFAAFGLH